MRLAFVVENFQFFRLRLRGTPHFDTSKFYQILSFLYMYLPLQFHVSSLNKKKFEFWRARLGGNPHHGTPNFC